MKDYLYISEALKCCRGNRKSNRDFGLANGCICSDSFAVLKEWADSRLSIHNLKSHLKERMTVLKRVWLILIVIATIAGITTSVSLLTYNGAEPVNILYFLIFSIILPLMGLVFTLISIMEIITYGDSIFIDLMPPYWIVSLFKKDKKEYKIPASLLKIYIIYMIQVISLIFYIAMLVGLLSIIGGKDVAFGWSSTLSLSAEELHRIFESIAFAWRDILPSAVPSVSLIEHSHYFRVGIWHPSYIAELGEWWQFLSMTIIVYAIFPRLILIPLIYNIYKRVERNTVLSLDSAIEVADEICEPVVESRAEEKEDILSYDIDKISSKNNFTKEYETIAGWSIAKDEVETVLTFRDIASKNIVELGGGNDTDNDLKTLDSIKKGRILVIVKGWEPPTMDLIDIVEQLSKKGMIVDIAPIGFADEGFECDSSDYEIWKGKIDYLNINRLEVVKI